MKAPFVFLLMLFSISSYSQNRNSIWCFGDSAGIDFRNPNNPIPISTSMDGRGSCVSISDSVGNLLFYANTNTNSCQTTLVRNSLDQVMDNGDFICGEAWYKELLILPYPDHPNLYYLITGSVTGCSISYEGLYFSIVDMSYNGGLGRVIQKNVRLLNFQVCDGLAAIKHGNGRDWWVFARQWDYVLANDYDEFHTFLITPDSIMGPYDQHIGSMSNNGFYRIEPSIDGRKIMCTERRGILELFDFDRCTGLLSNPLTIEARRPLFQYVPSYWSCELSPDKSKLYVSSVLVGPNQDSTYLFEYNLNAPNIAASRETLDIRTAIPFGGGMVELAPDNKIYYSMWYVSQNASSLPYQDSMYNYINQNLSVINFPDSLYPACDFQPFSFYLGGKRAYLGLPNNPNYELPALGGSICDTLGLPNAVNSEPSTVNKSGKLQVFYHPAWQTAFVNASGLKGRSYALHLVDISGKEVFSDYGNLQDEYFTKDVRCEQLSSGMYIVLFETEKERMVERFVVE